MDANDLDGMGLSVLTLGGDLAGKRVILHYDLEIPKGVLWRSIQTLAREFDYRPPFVCLDCGEIDWINYMVKNELWNEVLGPDAAKTSSYLHLECLQKRLGRKITADDLSEAPINDALRAILRTP